MTLYCICRVGELRKNTSYHTFLWIFGGCLLAVSALAQWQAQWEFFRWLRVGIIGFYAFALWFLHRWRPPLLVGAFVLLYGISSIFALYYEQAFAAYATLIFSIAGFTILVLGLLPRVRRQKSSLTIYIGLLIVLIINGYLCSRLVVLIEDRLMGDWQLVLAYVQSMLMVLSCCLALLRNFQVSNRSSLLLLVFVTCLCFSEVLRAIGYFDLAFVTSATIISRGLLIIAFVVLLRHSLIVSDQHVALQFPRRLK